MRKETPEAKAEREGYESGRDRGRVNDNPHFVGSILWHAYEDGQQEGDRDRQEGRSRE